MSSFHVIIRAEAGDVTGTGHVMRMLALAQALADRGAAATFVVARCPDELVKRLRAGGFAVEQLAGCEPGSQEDAGQTAALARALKARWIVLDGYIFGPDYQVECRKAGCKLLCVDDHHYGAEWHADVLLNQNLHAPAERAAYSRAAPGAELWLGSSFALMRREFWLPPKPGTTGGAGDCRHVLVTMGGGDAPNASAQIMEALALVSAVPLRVSVLVGITNAHRPQLESIRARHEGRFELMDAVEDMAALLEEVDAVITAGGSTCWEILWARKPAAVMVIADNQQPIAHSLEEQGLMLSLGRCGEISVADLAERLDAWLAGLPALPPSCPVDGRGARRVAAALDGCYSITLATAAGGWLEPFLQSLKTTLEAAGHRVQVATSTDEITGGDFLLLLSYWGIVPKAVLAKYLHSVVVHESDLPRGRGWSPATWAIVDGLNRIPLCLLEAGERVDRGDIYLRDELVLEGHELIAEWRNLLAARTRELCLRFIAGYPGVVSTREAQTEPGTCLRRRKPEDSRLEMDKTLAEQFHLLRVVDNRSYPAFFDHKGHRYILHIEKKSP